MKTEQEIVNKINEVREDDVFGTTTSDFMAHLSYESAKQFMRPDVTEEQWNEAKEENSQEAIEKIMLDYMSFAWDKANNLRGLSANRAASHYEAWTWLHSDELYNKIINIPYEHYGKEKLVAICEHFGWDYKQWDDGIRTNG